MVGVEEVSLTQLRRRRSAKWRTYPLDGRCCVPPARGMLKLRSPSDQIAKASSSNATATRRPTGSSTASPK
jgi:hypothetical protein